MLRLPAEKMIAIFLSKDAAIDNSPSADIYALGIAATVPDSGIRQAWKSLIPLLVNKATLIDLVRGRLFRELDKNIITYFGILLF